jgi:hypothetical protein
MATRWDGRVAKERRGEDECGEETRERQLEEKHTKRTGKGSGEWDEESIRPALGSDCRAHFSFLFHFFLVPC